MQCARLIPSEPGSRLRGMSVVAGAGMRGLCCMPVPCNCRRAGGSLHVRRGTGGFFSPGILVCTSCRGLDTDSGLYGPPVTRNTPCRRTCRPAWRNRGNGSLAGPVSSELSSGGSRTIYYANGYDRFAMRDGGSIARHCPGCLCFGTQLLEEVQPDAVQFPGLHIPVSPGCGPGIFHTWSFR